MTNVTDDDILCEYMDRLRWRLRRYPEGHFADSIREIRQHLGELVNEYIAAGYTPEQAVRVAESKFGSPERVASRLINEDGRRQLPRMLAVSILNMAWYMGLRGIPPINWGNLLFASAIGIGYGVLAGYWPEPLWVKSTTDRDKLKEFVWIVLVAVVAILLKFWVPVEDFVRFLAYMGIALAAGIPTYFAAKGIRNRRRRPSP